MTDNTEWLSNIDPDAPESSLTVESHPVDLVVENDELIVSDNRSAQINLSKYSGRAGVEQIDVSVDEVGTVSSTTTQGTIEAGKVRRQTTVEYANSGEGLFTTETRAPRGYVLHVQTPAVFTEETLTTVLTVEGIRYSVLNTYNSTYPIGKTLNGTALSNVDGVLWATGTSIENTYVLVEFPTVYEVSGFLFQNMRSDYAILTGVIEVPNGSGGWTVIHTFDASVDLMQLKEFRFAHSHYTQTLRLRALTRNATGAIGRLEFFRDNGIFDVTLTHKPLVIDTSKFDIVETTDSFSLSLKSQSGGGGLGDLAYLSSAYVKLEAHRPSTKKLGHVFTTVPKIHPLTTVIDNYLQVRTAAGCVYLEAGTYRYKISMPIGPTSTTFYYLMDVQNGGLLASPHSTINLTGAGTGVVTFDGTLTLHEPKLIALVSMVSATSYNLFSATAVDADISVGSLELWKLTDELLFAQRPVLQKPAEVAETLPILLMEASLSAGDGRGLDDGITDNAWNAVNGIYWGAANAYITFRVDHDFRFWRYPNASYLTYNHLLKVEKVEFDLIDYTSLLLPLTDEGMVWQRFSETFPPGTYKVSYGTGLRMDTEWCLEKMPFGTGGLIEKGVNVVKAMTSPTSSGQVVTHSSINSTTYAPWKAFDHVSGVTSNSGWASIARPTTAVPQWIAIQLSQVETITGYLIRNRAYGSYTQSPKTWELQGSNNGSDWTTIHSVVDDTNNVSAFDRYFALDNPETYQHFRLFITDANGNEGNYVVVEELELYYKAP